MNRCAIILLIISLLSISATAQNRIGIDIGIGCPPGYGPDLNMASDSHEIQTPRIMPCFGIYYQRKTARHIYIGGQLFFRSYNFSNNRKTISNLFNLFGGGTDTTVGTQVNCKNNYLCIAPMIDIGLGKKEIIHLFFMPGIGAMTNGYMTTTYYKTHSENKVIDYNDTYTTSSALNTIIFPVSYGMIEHIRLSNLWHITITESISNTLSPIADQKWTDNVPLKPNFLSLQLGIMHKYHHQKSNA